MTKQKERRRARNCKEIELKLQYGCLFFWKLPQKEWDWRRVWSSINLPGHNPPDNWEKILEQPAFNMAGDWRVFGDADGSERSVRGVFLKCFSYWVSHTNPFRHTFLFGFHNQRLLTQLHESLRNLTVCTVPDELFLITTCTQNCFRSNSTYPAPSFTGSPPPAIVTLGIKMTHSCSTRKR